MDRFKPREDRFAFIVALGRTFISLERTFSACTRESRLPTMSNAARSNPFFRPQSPEQWRKQLKCSGTSGEVCKNNTTTAINHYLKAFPLVELIKCVQGI